MDRKVRQERKIPFNLRSSRIRAQFLAPARKTEERGSESALFWIGTQVCLDEGQREVVGWDGMGPEIPPFCERDHSKN